MKLATSNNQGGEQRMFRYRNIPEKPKPKQVHKVTFLVKMSHCIREVLFSCYSSCCIKKKKYILFLIFFRNPETRYPKISKSQMIKIIQLSHDNYFFRIYIYIYIYKSLKLSDSLVCFLSFVLSGWVSNKAKTKVKSESNISNSLGKNKII